MKRPITTSQANIVACFSYIAQNFRVFVSAKELLAAEAIDTDCDPIQLIEKIAPKFQLRVNVFKKI